MSPLPASPPGVVLRGPPDALPVVYLHGFLGQAADWIPVMSALADRYAGVALDLPGHGACVGLSPPAYTVAGAVRLVLDALDALNINRAALVGYSLGGRLALALAHAAPTRWSALVLESASAGVREDHAREQRCAWDADWASRLEREPLVTVLRDWYAQPLFASLHRDPARLAALIETRATASPAELARALRGLGAGVQAPLWTALPGLRPPLLLIAGDADTRYLEITAQMRDLCPHAQRVIVPGAGHNTHMEQPSFFVETLRTFLGAHA